MKRLLVILSLALLVLCTSKCLKITAISPILAYQAGYPVHFYWVVKGEDSPYVTSDNQYEIWGSGFLWYQMTSTKSDVYLPDAVMQDALSQALFYGEVCKDASKVSIGYVYDDWYSVYYDGVLVIAIYYKWYAGQWLRGGTMYIQSNGSIQTTDEYGFVGFIYEYEPVPWDEFVATQS